jgi:hypothetical protein
MAITSYNCTLLTGGTAAALLDGDRAFCAVAGVEYYYVLDDNLGGAESSPRLILPDVNPGTKVWVLQQVNADGAVLKGGTNTFNVTNGTASLDVAAGVAADLNANLTIAFASVGGNSGVYTPTAVAILNVSAVTPALAHWIRVGNQVTVTGLLTAIDPVANAQTQFSLTLPVASNIGATTDLAGLLSCSTTTSGGYGVVYGGIANDVAICDYFSVTTVADTLGYTFTYTVI